MIGGRMVEWPARRLGCGNLRLGREDYQYAIQRPAAITPTQASSETHAATFAPMGPRALLSHLATLRNAVNSKTIAFNPAKTMSDIFKRKAPFSYIFVASDANMNEPVVIITAKPVQVHLINWWCNSDTRWLVKMNPSSRRSRTPVVPTSRM